MKKITTTLVLVLYTIALHGLLLKFFQYKFIECYLNYTEDSLVLCMLDSKFKGEEFILKEHVDIKEEIKKEEPKTEKVKTYRPLQETIKAGKYTIKTDQAKKVIEVFGRDETMLAIIFAESGFDSSKTNYNCFYKKSDTGTYVKPLNVSLDFTNVSKERRKGDVGWACKKGHEKYAFSKDIGLIMLNTDNGAKVGDLDHNLAIGKKILNESGYTAWSAFSLGLHKQYIDEAKTVLEHIK